MKRIFSLCAAVVLTSLLTVPVLAAPQANLVRAFLDENVLYTYTALEDSTEPITKAEAKIGSQSFPAAQNLETVLQAGSPVHYLLLVDCSNSMPPFAADVRNFAAELAGQSGENTRYTLATLGDGFTVLAEELQGEELLPALEKIRYDVTVTRLNTSIRSALDYFDGLPRSNSELRTLIVVSDAVEYDPQSTITDEDLLERVCASDVMVHGLGLGTDQEALSELSDLVSASGGISRFVGENCTAVQAARDVANFGESLYITGFDLSACTTVGEDTPFSVVFSSGTELLCRAEAAINLPEQLGDEINTLEEPLPMPENPAPSHEASSQVQATVEDKKSGVPMAVPMVILVIVIVVFAVVLLQKKKKATVSDKPEPAPIAEAPGIFMRAEMLEGSCETPEFCLAGEMIIGSGSSCGLVVNGDGVEVEHAVLFINEQGVWIRDLGSTSGTKVNGQQVLSPVRLRSGDQVALGSTHIVLKF